MTHPFEFLLRFALAITAASAAMAVALALNQRWLLILVLPAYVATIMWGRPVTAWLLTPEDGGQP